MTLTERYPPLSVQAQPAEYKPYAQFMDDFAATNFGGNGKTIVYEDSKGGLLGAFPLLINSKDVGESLIKTYMDLSAQTSFPVDAREVTILVLGTRFNTIYNLYSRTNIGIKIAGLSPEQVSTIKKGKKPGGLSQAASVSYDAAHYLANVPGPLPKDLYDPARRVLGEEGVMTMANWAGMYAYLNVLMNFGDVPLPPGQDE